LAFVENRHGKSLGHQPDIVKRLTQRRARAPVGRSPVDTRRHICQGDYAEQ
jgi:hypothetical protein